MSSRFEWAKRQTIELLRDEMLDLNLLLLALDEWADVWQRDEDFENVVKEFRDATQKSEDKGKFVKWLENRSYVEATDQTASTRGAKKVPLTIVQFGQSTKPNYRSTRDSSMETDSQMVA